MVPPKTYAKGVPTGYNLQTICAYHSGSPDRSTVNYWVLNHKIQDMINAEDIVLRRRDESGSNVSKNPFPEYKGTVGAIYH